MIARISPAATAQVGQGSSGHAPGLMPPIDLAHLARYTLHDAALEQEILDLFARQAPVNLARLRQANGEKQWRDAVHTLKGSARAIGAWRLALHAEECELEPGWGSAVSRARAIAGFERALQDVQEFISSRFVRRSA